MSQLLDALNYMAQHGQMTDFSCWFTNLSKDGTKDRWHASVKIEGTSCFVGEGNNPEEALLDALGQAWNALSKRE